MFLFMFIVFLLHSIFTLAQTVIYAENFDTDSTALPAGWSSSPASGWEVETSAPSTGYPGASGLFNVVIRNADSSNVYYLFSKDVSTIGYDSIAVSWGARLTTNFSALGSTIQSFDLSADSGNTWTIIPYIENANTNLWNLDNDNRLIYLPGIAGNQPAIRFRWVAQIVNAYSDNYRIDDFIVSSASAITGNNEINFPDKQAFIFPDPSSGQIIVSCADAIEERGELAIYNSTGQQVQEFPAGINQFIQLDLSGLPDGIYMVVLNVKDKMFSAKLVLS